MSKRYTPTDDELEYEGDLDPAQYDEDYTPGEEPAVERQISASALPADVARDLLNASAIIDLSGQEPDQPVLTDRQLLSNLRQMEWQTANKVRKLERKLGYIKPADIKRNPKAAYKANQLREQIAEARSRHAGWMTTIKSAEEKLGIAAPPPETMPSADFDRSKGALDGPRVAGKPSFDAQPSTGNAPRVIARPKTAAPPRFDGITLDDWTPPDQLRDDFLRALDAKLGADANYSLSQRTPFHYDLTIGDEDRLVTFDPVFAAPVFEGKIIRRERGETAAQAAASALVESNFARAIEAGLGVPQIDEMTGRHLGGNLSRSFVARIKAMMEIDPEAIKLYQRRNEQGPIMHFQNDPTLLALPANLQGTDSTMSDRRLGGMMGWHGPSVLSETVGWDMGEDGRLLAPQISKSQSRLKALGNEDPNSMPSLVDIKYHRDPENEQNRIGKTRLRPRSGEVNPEVIADTLILPDMVTPQGEVYASTNLADRVVMHRRKAIRETLSWADLKDIVLTDRERVGKMVRSSYLPLYSKNGVEYAHHDPDATYSVLDAIRAELPSTSDTGWWLLNFSERFKNEAGQPFHIAMGEHMQALTDPEQYRGADYNTAKELANRILRPYSYQIGRGEKVGGAYQPRLRAVHRVVNHIREGDKFQGTTGNKGIVGIRPGEWLAAQSPSHGDVLGNVDVVLGGNEPVKLGVMYQHLLANEATRHPFLRDALEAAGLPIGDDGTIPYTLDTHDAWQKATQSILVDAMEGRNPTMQKQLVDAGILIPNIQLDQKLAIAEAGLLRSAAPDYNVQMRSAQGPDPAAGVRRVTPSKQVIFDTIQESEEYEILGTPGGRNPATGTSDHFKALVATSNGKINYAADPFMAAEGEAWVENGTGYIRVFEDTDGTLPLIQFHELGHALHFMADPDALKRGDNTLAFLFGAEARKHATPLRTLIDSDRNDEELDTSIGAIRTAFYGKDREDYQVIGNEQMADALGLYLNDPDKFRTADPTLAAEVEAYLGKHHPDLVAANQQFINPQGTAPSKGTRTVERTVSREVFVMPDGREVRANYSETAPSKLSGDYPQFGATNTARWGIRGLLPFSIRMGTPVSGRSGNLNYTDVSRIFQVDRPLYEEIRGRQEGYSRLAIDLLESTQNVPISPEAVTNSDGFIFTPETMPSFEERARQMEETEMVRHLKARGVKQAEIDELDLKPERAADRYYAQAMKEYLTDPESGQVRPFALERGGVRQRLMSPETALYFGNFGLEGDNSSRLFASWINLVRNEGNEDVNKFVHHLGNYNRHAEAMTRTNAVRKMAFAGPVEGSSTVRLTGALNLPPNTVVSPLARQLRENALNEADPLFDQVKAIMHRWPTMTHGQNSVLNLITPEEANALYDLGLSADPKHMPRNAVVIPSAAMAGVMQSDFDGDTGLLVPVNGKLAVASPQDLLHESLITGQYSREEVEAFMADPSIEGQIRAWGALSNRDLAGGDIRLKPSDWMDSFRLKEDPGKGGRLGANIKKRALSEPAVTGNVPVMQAAINEAHAKGMVGSVDTGFETLMEMSGIVGQLDPETWKYLSAAVGMNSKQGTIDIGGKHDLSKLDAKFGHMRPNYFPHLFDRNNQSGVFVNLAAEWLNRSRRNSVPLQSVEPLFRSQDDLGTVNQPLYDYLKLKSDAGSDVIPEELHRLLVGKEIDSDNIPVDWTERFLDTTIFGRWGRALQMQNTLQITENNATDDLSRFAGVSPDDDIRARLYQAGVQQAPKWYSSLIAMNNDPAQLKISGAWVKDVPTAEKAVSDFLERQDEKHPERLDNYIALRGRRFATSNQTFNILENEGSAAYPTILESASQTGDDLFTYDAQGRLRGILDAPHSSWRNSGDVGISLQEFNEFLRENAAAARDLYRQSGGNLSKVLEKEWPSTAVFNPSQLKPTKYMQQMVEGHALNSRQRTLGIDPQDRENMERGTFWHEAYGRMRQWQGVPKERLEQNVLWTGAGMFLNGRLDEEDPSEGSVTDAKFMSHSRFEKGAKAAQEYFPQLSSYLYGKSEMTGTPYNVANLQTYDADVADSLMERVLTNRIRSGEIDFQLRRPDETRDGWFSRAMRAGHISGRDVYEVLKNTPRRDYQIDRTDPDTWPAHKAQLGEYLNNERRAAYIAHRYRMGYTKPLSRGRGGNYDQSRNDSYQIAEARAKQQVIREALQKPPFAGQTSYRYEEPWYMREEGAEHMPLSADAMRRRRATRQNNSDAEATSQRETSSFLDAQDLADAGPAAPRAPPSLPNPAAPGLNVDDFQLDPVDMDAERFAQIAAVAGIAVETGVNLPGGHMGLTNRLSSKDGPRIAIGGNVGQHRQPNLVRFHELGHGIARLQYEQPTDYPSTLSEMLGMIHSPGAEQALMRQAGYLRAAHYGNLPTGEQPNAQEAARLPEVMADAIGLSLKNPTLAADVAPQLAQAVHAFVQNIDPAILDAAGALNMLNSGGSGRTPNRPQVAAGAGGNGAKPPNGGAVPAAAGGQDPGMGGGGQFDPMSASLGLFANAQQAAQANGGSYYGSVNVGPNGLVTARWKELKVPGDDGVPGIGELQKAVNKTAKYFDETNGVLERFVKLAKDGNYQWKDWNHGMNEYHRVLKSAIQMLPDSRDYNLRLGKRNPRTGEWEGGDPLHVAFKDSSDKLRRRLGDAQHNAQYVSNRARLADLRGTLHDMEHPEDKVRRKRGRQGSGMAAGMGDEGGGIWGRFTDELGGMAGLGWLGWGAFSWQRINNLMFGGIRQDLEMFRTGQIGVEAMHRAQNAKDPNALPLLTEELTANEFVANYVRYKTGERLQGFSSSVDNTWNRLFSIDQQTNIHTAKELGKGAAGALGGLLISAWMGNKAGGAFKRAFSLTGAGAGFVAGQEADDPFSAVMGGAQTAIELTTAQVVLSQLLGGNAKKKLAQGAAGTAAAEAGKFAGLRQAASFLGPIGKAAALASMAISGIQMGSGIIADAVTDDADIDSDVYDRLMRQNSAIRAIAPWLAAQDPGEWGYGYQQYRLNRGDDGRPHFFTKNTDGSFALFRWASSDQMYDEARARGDKEVVDLERDKAARAFRRGDLSQLPIKTDEDLMYFAGLAGAGSTPEEVSRNIAQFMELTGESKDDLKDPNNPAVKLLKSLVQGAIREDVSLNQKTSNWLTYLGGVGLHPTTRQAFDLSNAFTQQSGMVQTSILTGLDLMRSNWDNWRMGLQPSQYHQMAGQLGDMARFGGYSHDQFNQGLQLVQPKSPYTFNLGLRAGTISAGGILANYGIQNIAPTMDLSTGLGVNQETIWGLDAQMRSNQYAHQMWSSDYQEREYSRKWNFQDEMMRLGWDTSQMQYQHQVAGAHRQLANIQANLGMQLAERGLQRQIMMTQYGHQEEDMAIGRERQQIQWGWRFEDADYTRDRTGLEYGWRQADYGRALRQATGREKIEVRRQMERDQIRYGMDEDRRDVEEDRLREQRSWEDEDFDRKKSHYEELKGLQIELFEMQTSHMIQSAAMQIANIQARLAEMEKEQELAKTMHDKKLADLVADKEAWYEQFERYKAFWQQQWDLEQKKIDATLAQERAVAAMNLYFEAWKNELLPALYTLALKIKQILDGASGAGGPPLGPLTEDEAQNDHPWNVPGSLQTPPGQSGGEGENAWVRDPETGVVTYPNHGSIPVGTPVGPDVRPEPDTSQPGRPVGGPKPELPGGGYRDPGDGGPGGGSRTLSINRQPTAFRQNMSVDDIVEQLAEMMFGTHAARDWQENQYDTDRKR